MLKPALFSGHLALAHQYLAQYSALLAQHQIAVSASLQLATTTQLYPHYDQHTQHICLNLIDSDDPLWQIRALAIMAFWGFKNSEIDQFLDYWLLHLRYTIAHELGHHLRHHYGRLDLSKVWHEEQIANRFATALSNAHFTPAERARYRGYLQRNSESLAAKVEVNALSAYGHIHYALHALGLIDDSALATLISAPTQTELGEMLSTVPGISAEVRALAAMRQPLIARFNSQYNANPIEYIYYQTAWTYYELICTEVVDLHRLAETYLGPRSSSIPETR
jgi:hypothetical protein